MSPGIKCHVTQSNGLVYNVSTMILVLCKTSFFRQVKAGDLPAAEDDLIGDGSKLQSKDNEVTINRCTRSPIWDRPSRP